MCADSSFILRVSQSPRNHPGLPGALQKQVWKSQMKRILVSE